jgi:ribosomal protein L37AE/L43A
MQNNSSLTKRIAQDYPHLQLVIGDEYRWSPRTQSITHPATYDPALLLHEVAHALLEHDMFALDITLLKKERAAWEYAESALAKHYGITITNEQREDALDTYREWLHMRSLCPTCKMTAIQQKTGVYQCSTCKRQWRVGRSADKRIYRTQLH